MSSMGSDMPTPIVGLNQGTKRFNDIFGQLAGQKAQDKGMDIMIVKPGFVRTEMVNFTKNPLGQSVEETSKAIVASFGHTKMLFPGIWHSFQGWFMFRLLFNRANGSFVQA